MSSDLVLRFEHDGLPGQVAVAVAINDDPPALGGDAANLGFPYCTARVDFSGRGYRAMFGWVQLVRSTDAGTDGFEMDPYLLFPDADSPYAFYGHLPTLFDAPGRASRRDMRWQAQSFLAVTPIEFRARDVTALQGFSWGFSVTDGQVLVDPADPLPAAAWNAHLTHLAESYPSWRFARSPGWSD